MLRCLHVQPPEHRPASRQSSRSRISLSCEAKLEDGHDHLDTDNTHLRGESSVQESHHDCSRVASQFLSQRFRHACH